MFIDELCMFHNHFVQIIIKIQFYDYLYTKHNAYFNILNSPFSFFCVNSLCNDFFDRGCITIACVCKILKPFPGYQMAFGISEFKILNRTSKILTNIQEAFIFYLITLTLSHPKMFCYLEKVL